MADNAGRPAGRDHAPVDPAHAYHVAHPAATEPDVEAAALRETADLALRLRRALDALPDPLWLGLVGVDMPALPGRLRSLEARCMGLATRRAATRS